MSEDLDLALELADHADAITLDRFRAGDLVVETKPDLTPVTEADRAAEEAIRERLAVERPDDAIVGEEFGSTAGAARQWVIDPIDGTKNYVRGIPVWATLIALRDQVAVVSAPALRRRWWASRGQGAFADDRRMHVSAVSTLADAQLLWSGIEDWDGVHQSDALLALARSCWRSRGLGDFWQYMLVAEGAAEIALDPEVNLWDLAAPQLIVEEAGGRFTDLSGAARPDGGSGIATNGRLHEEALKFVRR